MQSPLFSIINFHRCFIESIKLIRTEFGILSHSSAINCSNSLQFLGSRLSTFVLTMIQRFSIELRSRLLEASPNHWNIVLKKTRGMLRIVILLKAPSASQQSSYFCEVLF